MCNCKSSMTAMVLLALTIAAPTALLAGQKDRSGHGRDASGHAAVEVQAEVDHARVFDSREREMIVEYFRTNHQQTKPLPPGIAKNYARGKPLPPGIAKRYLPGELDQLLPVREGYERMIVGRDIVLVELATRLIVDIIADVL